jgi:hypothetical protein
MIARVLALGQGHTFATAKPARTPEGFLGSNGAQRIIKTSTSGAGERATWLRSIRELIGFKARTHAPGPPS